MFGVKGYGRDAVQPVPVIPESGSYVGPFNPRQDRPRMYPKMRKPESEGLGNSMRIRL